MKSATAFLQDFFTETICFNKTIWLNSLCLDIC
jgi:hypothetical protein